MKDYKKVSVEKTFFGINYEREWESPLSSVVGVRQIITDSKKYDKQLSTLTYFGLAFACLTAYFFGYSQLALILLILVCFLQLEIISDYQHQRGYGEMKERKR